MLTFYYFMWDLNPRPSALKAMDWAGFEPATFRLRTERSYQTELPAREKAKIIVIDLYI
jgi:hypothetical protein